MRDLLEIIAELGIELHPDRIEILAEKIKTINSAEQFVLLKPAFGSSINNKTISEIETAWKNNKHIYPQEFSAALRGASATAVENERRGKSEIVWTGPSTDQVPIRHTEQVLCEVINNAKRHLFIVSFVAYKIDSVINALRDAICRNVKVIFIMELSSEHGGQVSQDSIKMMNKLLPSAEMYSWSENSKLSIEQPLGAIHAKCAVADGELAFITSANLTNAAMERNIELGVLVRGGKLPADLEKHLKSLIAAGIFQKI